MPNEMLSRVLGTKFRAVYLKYYKKIKDQKSRWKIINRNVDPYIDVDPVIAKMKK